MSFNIGGVESKYVSVKNPNIRFNYSDKVIFAELTTSRKTGRAKIDEETGEALIDSNGNPIPERAYYTWEGRFVGNAFEPSKGLKNGQMIDIEVGWIEKEANTSKSGKEYINYYVTISDFRLSSFDIESQNEEDIYDYI